MLVTSCKDCPFYEHEDDRCYHPTPAQDGLVYVRAGWTHAVVPRYQTRNEPLHNKGRHRWAPGSSFPRGLSPSFF